MVYCTCDEWKEGRKQLDGFITFGFIHRMKYTGGTFKFCPWCGKELLEDEKK
jgi:hypothetical protein